MRESDKERIMSAVKSATAEAFEDQVMPLVEELVLREELDQIRCELEKVNRKLGGPRVGQPCSTRAIERIDQWLSLNSEGLYFVSFSGVKDLLLQLKGILRG